MKDNYLMLIYPIKTGHHHEISWALFCVQHGIHMQKELGEWMYVAMEDA